MGCEQRELSAAAPLSSAWVHQAFFSSSTVAAGRVQGCCGCGQCACARRPLGGEGDSVWRALMSGIEIELHRGDWGPLQETG